MKIGILTFHLAHNYGAVLQCYALQEVLGRMGHQVSIINYQQPSEPPKKIDELKSINLPRRGKKLAAILLTVKK